jgi:hypothetical protein
MRNLINVSSSSESKAQSNIGLGGVGRSKKHESADKQVA